MPLVLCKHIVQNRLFTQARLYLYLKWITDGEIIFNHIVKENCVTQLKISKRTFERNLIWLFQNGWIVQEYKSKYRVIGFAPLCRSICEPISKTGYRWEKPKFDDCKAFLIAACLCKCISIVRARRRAAVKGAARFALPVFLNSKKHIIDEKFLVPNKPDYVARSYFAMFLNIPLTTAYDYMQIAVKGGFVTKETHKARTIVFNRFSKHYMEYSQGENMFLKNTGRKKAELVLPNSYISNLRAKKIRGLFDKN